MEAVKNNKMSNNEKLSEHIVLLNASIYRKLLLYIQDRVHQVSLWKSKIRNASDSLLLTII